MKLTRTKKILGAAGGVLLLLVILIVVAYANLTALVRTALEKELPGLTFKTLDVGWNRVVVEGVELKRKSKVVFKVDALRVYPSLSSLFSDTIVVSSVEIEKPYLFVVRNADGSLTLPVPEQKDAPKRVAKKEEPEESSKSQTRIHVGKIRISDGSADLEDRSVYGAPAKIKLSKLMLKVDDVDMPMGDGKIPFDVSAQLDGKRPGKLSADGWYIASTNSAEADIELEDLFMPTAEPYYRGKYTTATISDGLVQMDADVKMKDGRYAVDLDLEISDLAFAREGLLFGVPVALLIDREKQQKEPFKLKTKIEGSAKDKEHFQQRLVTALVAAVAKELGTKVVTDAAEKAISDKLGGANKDAVKGLFGF